MELAPLIQALRSPAAYSEPPDAVEVRQTHISVVFLAGRHVYKIKKPVNPGFLDFRTLEARRHFCEEEVRLNRRLAPRVYKGVVPVTQSDKRIQIDGDGEVIDWAVHMERLPDEATLRARLRRGEVDAGLVEYLARQIAAFHAAAETSPAIAAFGQFEMIATNIRENFTQVVAQVGDFVSRPVFERLRARSEEALARLRRLIAARAERGAPRDTHGDLRVEHIYLFPEKYPPDDLVIIDCIEFNERFRYADPVADMAFVVMDLIFEGRRDLAQRFAHSYFQAAHDDEGRALLPLYTAYRAAVRGKVGGLKCAGGEVPDSERASVRARAQAHWLLALGELESPDQKPCLVFVGGLPGSGKSTLAHALLEHTPFHLLRTDLVRKELAERAGILPESSTNANIYTPEWTARTYAECLRRAEEHLFAGERVLIDATFREEKWRRAFLETAARWAVPTVFLLCSAPPDMTRTRIEGRRKDASDADWSVYLLLAQSWEEVGSYSRPFLRAIETGGGREDALAQALTVLRELGVHAEHNEA